MSPRPRSCTSGSCGGPLGRRSSRRPAIERRELTASHPPGEAVELIRARTSDGMELVRGLTDAQLDLPTKPPRAHGQHLAETIKRVLIGHIDVHRQAIEGKLDGTGADG